MLRDDARRGKGFAQKGVLRGLGLSIIFCLLFLSGAYGADYPTKPIQIIIPFAAGGPNDVTSRILSTRISDILGQPVVVVNKSGGSGAIATRYVLGERADGHTILCIEVSLITNPLINKDIGWSLDDFTPINLATIGPLNITVKKDAAWNTFEEIVADAKKNPGKISYSSGGPTTISGMAGELVQMVTGAKFTHVPYSGGAGAVTALLGGHVNMTFISPMVVKAHYEAGAVKLLATMYSKRYFRDIPTTAEKGYPKLTCGSWTAYFVSAKTPKAIVKRLEETFKKVIQEKEVVELIEKTGFMVENLGTQEAARFLADEQEKYSEVIEVIKVIKEKGGK